VAFLTISAGRLADTTLAKGVATRTTLSRCFLGSALGSLFAFGPGSGRAQIQAGDAPPVTRTGRYLTVWKRQPDGVWRIRVDAIVPDPSP
jgi:hypothetical protein